MGSPWGQTVVVGAAVQCLIEFFYQIVFLPLDFQQSEIWEQVLQFEEPQLIRLAQALPRTVLQARAKGTTDKYAGAYRRWKVWAEGVHSGSGFPVNVALFALYLQHVGETIKSRSAVSEAVNALSWVQLLAGVEPVSHNPFIKAINEGFQRSLARPRQRKEPVTPEMLGQVVASFGTPPSLAEVRLGSICLLAYAAFLRINELRQLRCQDIQFTEEGMSVNIVKSKTDQYRQGQAVPISRTGNPTCPVAMMRKYVDMGGIDTSSELSLFRAICSVRGKESLRPSGALSYSRTREIVLGKFGQLGYDVTEFGLYSFRAGGATRAANCPGLPERLFKRHGRWKSERAKDGYVKDPLEKRLKVSRSLGL